MPEYWTESLQKAVRVPRDEAVEASRRRVNKWFEQTAPLVQWDAVETPLGPVYIAASDQGICSVDFGLVVDLFLNKLDPLARVKRSPSALSPAARQIQEYFDGIRTRFDLPLDLRQLTPFQQSVLQVARTIARGSMWTYQQVAAALGKPRASRSVGQALGHNPVPIIIPCHRVIASDGSLGGYSAGAGLESKEFLLRLEGALA